MLFNFFSRDLFSAELLNNVSMLDRIMGCQRLVNGPFRRHVILSRQNIFRQVTLFSGVGAFSLGEKKDSLMFVRAACLRCQGTKSVHY